MTLDWVCPVIARDADRFRILLDSYRAFCRAPGTFYVLPPQDDLALFASIVGADSRFQIVSQESVLAPPQEGYIPAGWYRQQMVKIACAKFTSERYAAIDADCFFAAPFLHTEFAERPVGTLVPMGDPRYYKGAQRALGYNAVLPPSRMLLRPPFFFSKQVMLQAMHRIEDTHQIRWEHALQRVLPWAEVPLHHLTMEMYGVEYDNVTPYTHEPTSWPHEDVEKEFSRWDPDETFEHYAFGVIHGKTGIDPARVRRKLKGRL